MNESDKAAIPLSSKRQVKMKLHCPTDKPVTITLPDGRIIEADGVPYDGWGTKSGKRYMVTRHDADGNITSKESWVVR